jgi:hypothetical protein
MSSPRKLFTKRMPPTGLDIPDYSPLTITYDKADLPEGDASVSDGRLNLEHYLRVVEARDAIEARQIRVNQ